MSVRVSPSVRLSVGPSIAPPDDQPVDRWSGRSPTWLVEWPLAG